MNKHTTFYLYIISKFIKWYKNDPNFCRNSQDF